MPKRAPRELDEPSHSVSEVVELLGCSRSHVYHLMRDGELDTVDIGRGMKRATYRVTDRSLRAFISRRNAAEAS